MEGFGVQIFLEIVEHSYLCDPSGVPPFRRLCTECIYPKGFKGPERPYRSTDMLSAAVWPLSRRIESTPIQAAVGSAAKVAERFGSAAQTAYEMKTV
jgi:hypothetical protein